MKTIIASIIASALIVGVSNAEAQFSTGHQPAGADASFTTNRLSLPGEDAGRAAFEWTLISHEYDLEKEVSAVGQSQTNSPMNASSVSFAAKTLASMLGVPVKSSTDVRRQGLEMGYLRGGKNLGRRQEWSQYLARFTTNDAPWLLMRDEVPERMTIFIDGVEHFWLRSEGQWTRSQNSGGLFLVPPFETFGRISKYVGRDQEDTNRWLKTEIRTGGLIRIVWKSAPGLANREVGVELFEDHPDRVHRGWWGKIDAPSNIETYSNYIAVSDGVFYPQYSHFVTQLSFETNKSLLLKEEIYTVLDTNVLFDGWVDPIYFDPNSYPWTKLQ